MRWLSSFAILVYLSLLCTPQAFAVQDTRLSPLAETQFLALNPVLLQQAPIQQDDYDDEPPAAFVSAALCLPPLLFTCTAGEVAITICGLYRSAHHARAPPLFSLAYFNA